MKVPTPLTYLGEPVHDLRLCAPVPARTRMMQRHYSHRVTQVHVAAKFRVYRPTLPTHYRAARKADLHDRTIQLGV